MAHFRLKEAMKNMQAKFETLHAANEQKKMQDGPETKAEDLTVAISFQWKTQHP